MSHTYKLRVKTRQWVKNMTDDELKNNVAVYHKMIPHYSSSLYDEMARELTNRNKVRFTYEDYRHYIGSNDIDGNVITSDRLKTWASKEYPDFICIFCGKEADHNGNFYYCRRCNEYKGIIPNC